jgi:hypothetical protein
VEVTDVTHPSVEEVALHLEGVLEHADEQRVRAHLEQCTDCAATARGLEGLTGQLHAAAHSSEPPLPIPTDVAASIESALAREAGERGPVSGTDGAPVDEAGARGPVDDLAERRRRRRRVLSGGLLAAAAATVVAVGLGELVQTGGGAAGGSAESATAQGTAGRRPDSLRGPAISSSLDAKEQTPAQAAGEPGTGGPHGVGPGGPRAHLQGRRGDDAALIAGVAAAHAPERAQHDRPGCVRAALGDDLGPVASYAVRLPGITGPPAVVVLRPNLHPTVGVLVACTPQPRVLARHGLQP